MTTGQEPWPTEIRVLRSARRLDLDFDTGETFALPASLVRAMTPSASERGHGAPTDAPAPKPFTDVTILDAQPVGAYAVRLVFSDGHDSGLYTWETLHRLGRDLPALVAEHRRLADAAPR